MYIYIYIYYDEFKFFEVDFHRFLAMDVSLFRGNFITKHTKLEAS